jgi:predicted branched-subunit amino acid permease
MTRILGVSISIVSILLLAIAIYGLRSANNVSHVLMDASKAVNQAYQPERWKTHFTVYWMSWLVASALALAGGLFLFLRKSVGVTFVMTGALVVLLYPFVVECFGERTYAFENVHYPTAVIAGLVAVISGIVRFVYE